MTYLVLHIGYFFSLRCPIEGNLTSKHNKTKTITVGLTYQAHHVVCVQNELQTEPDFQPVFKS